MIPGFKTTHVKRALAAAQKVGLLVSGYEIAPDGRIVVHTAVEKIREDDADSVLAEWMEKNGRG